MKGRIKEDDSSVPAPDGEFEYFTRYESGGQHPLFCRRSTGGTGDGECCFTRQGSRRPVLLPGRRLQPFHGHARLAYALDTNGSEIFTVKIRDLASGGDLDDRIPRLQRQYRLGKRRRDPLLHGPRRQPPPLPVNRHRVGTGRTRTSRSTRRPTRVSSSGRERARAASSWRFRPMTTPPRRCI